MRLWAATSRYSPANHICTGPPGGSASRPTRPAPPTRASIFATTTRAPAGPYQAAKCSGSVHSLHSSSTGAAKLRSITTASWATLSSVIVAVRSGSRREPGDVVVHPVQTALPVGPAPLRPGGDLLERRWVEGARPVLGPARPNDQ